MAQAATFESLSTLNSGSATRTLRRFWIERDHVVRPFFWHGFWPALGLLLLTLFALLPFARSDIESTVGREVRASLAAAGLGWADVSVSGQNVVLRGTEPVAGAGDRALEIARAATCPTWIGRSICAVAVSGRFDAPAALAVPAASAPEPVAAPAPAGAAAAAAAESCERSLGEIVGRQRIEFATGSATIKAASAPVIRALAESAARCPGTIEIQGHTDSVGAAEMNRGLSQARADAVVAALVEQGFPRERLSAQGFGPDRPVAANDTAEGRAQNRRIEFRVLAGEAASQK